MVQARQFHPLHSESEIEIESWVDSLLEKVPDLVPSRSEIIDACQLAQLVEINARDEKVTPWGPGGNSFLTGMEMVQILSDLHLDRDILLTALLYRAVREEKLALDSVKKRFGKTVASLIESVQRMAVISTLRNDADSSVFGHAAGQQASKVREMLVSIIDDIRVALIKLAERTCAIRAVKTAPPEKRLRVSKEIFDVYAPLAHRLGIGHLKWELEDLAFRYLEPEEYQQIAKLLDERRIDRQKYIENTVSVLEKELTKAAIKGEVSGRVKHIYSIWRKMHRKDIGISQVYDMRAVRLLVPTVNDCYTMLGVVHSLWRNIPNEFDDYVAVPKENGYRSLHTAVIGPERRVLEIQIRTFDMHEEAELGVCAHWRYKGGKDTNNNYEDRIAWLRQVLEWHEEIEGDSTATILKNQLSEDRIYVFTPDGHVVDLPQGATPLDFAYRVHTEIGHRCRGAKVNSKIVPLNYQLRTGEQVDILKGSQESPSRDWLMSAMGYLKTGRARSKIQHWFRMQNREENIEAGKHLLEKELRLFDMQLGKDELEKISARMNKHGAEGLYQAVGAGEIGVERIVQYLRRAHRKTHLIEIRNRMVPASRVSDSDIYIYGVDNLLTHVAGCCKPVPGEEISAYITSGRGASIHRKDCGNLLRLQAAEPQRILEVSWGGAPKQVYEVSVQVEGYDRPGLLRDITTTLDDQGVNILGVNSQSNTRGRKDTFSSRLILEVGNFEQLNSVLKHVQQIPNISFAKRVDN